MNRLFRMVLSGEDRHNNWIRIRGSRQTENTNPGWQPFGYAGGLADSQTGLIRFGARDYDPSIGRWTAKDAIGFAGGAFSLYEYANNDPINLIDIQGTSAWSAMKAFGIGAVTGLIGAVATGATLAALAAISPAASVVGMVALAAYGGWQLGMAGQRILLGFDPWTGCELAADIRIDEAAHFIGALVGGTIFSGPKGPLFGRGLYRDGRPGWFNRGRTRVGWSWDDALGRNMWGTHGNRPRWHRTPVPGPQGGDGWW